MGYSKEVYDRAWSVLQQRAQQARARSEARRTEIDAQIPEIARLEREMAATAAEVTRSVIADPQRVEGRIERLREQNLALQHQREQLLIGHGYSADYLAEQHGCMHCRDSGYIGSHMCSCLSGLLRQMAYEQLSESSRVQECRFDNFSLQYYPDRPVDTSGVIPRQRMAQILDFCRQYTDSFTQQADSLLLLGQTGLGKTHLSLAVASAVTEQGYGVVYTPVHKLLNRLEAEKFSRAAEGQYMDSIDWVVSCDLLVLDDLGTEFHTQFTASVLYNIINSRLVENRPTIISTNLDLAQIEEKYSQRMVSRMVCSYRVLKFCGKDIRYIRKAEQHR